MPRRRRLDHDYSTKTHTAFTDVSQYHEVPVTTVFSHVEQPWGNDWMGSSIDLVHPRTLGPDHPDVEEHNATKENPQMELFQHHGPTLDNYNSHSRSKHTAPIVLGIAAHLSKQQFGAIPDSSTNLSEHSLRVAQQLGDAVPNHSELPKSPTNYMTEDLWNDFEMNEHIGNLKKYNSTPVSSEDVAKGTDVIKQVVKRRINKRKQAKEVTTTPAPTPKAPKPDQLRIPGL
jgi:hypothetical protein